jgi:hypothetical protein
MVGTPTIKKSIAWSIVHRLFLIVVINKVELLTKKKEAKKKIIIIIRFINKS